jgi:hypothetical protein
MVTRPSNRPTAILIAWTFTSILLMLSLLGPIPSAIQFSPSEPTATVELASDDERLESEQTDFWVAGSFEAHDCFYVVYGTTWYSGLSSPKERCSSHWQRGPPNSWS